MGIRRTQACFAMFPDLYLAAYTASIRKNGCQKTRSGIGCFMLFYPSMPPAKIEHVGPLKCFGL